MQNTQKAESVHLGCFIGCEVGICDGEIPIVFVDSSSLAVEFQRNKQFHVRGPVQNSSMLSGGGTWRHGGQWKDFIG